MVTLPKQPGATRIQFVSTSLLLFWPVVSKREEKLFCIQGFPPFFPEHRLLAKQLPELQHHFQPRPSSTTQLQHRDTSPRIYAGDRKCTHKTRVLKMGTHCIPSWLEENNTFINEKFHTSANGSTSQPLCNRHRKLMETELLQTKPLLYKEHFAVTLALVTSPLMRLK